MSVNNMPYNTAEDETLELLKTTDRVYHTSENFMYRYRWWIVLVLALLLGVYLIAKKDDDMNTAVVLASNAAPTAMIATEPPQLGGSFYSSSLPYANKLLDTATFTIASAPGLEGINPDDRHLFRM